MTDEIRVPFKLKEPMIDVDGIPIIDASKIEKSGEELANMSAFEIRKLAPSVTIGESLMRTLVNGIKVKDAEEGAKVWRFSQKIRNKLQTDKAEWNVSEQDIKDCMAFLKKLDKDQKVSRTVGQIQATLEDLLDEIKMQTRNEN